MDNNNEINQLVEDLDKIMNLFKKMENSSIKDVDSLKKESILLQKELKERYGEENPPETDTPKA